MANFIKDWTQKEVESLTKSFRRYSVFVILLKYILPLSALGMAAVLFVYPAMTGSNKKIVLIAQDVSQGKSSETPVMQSPKFVGIDSKNQPYQISAKSAVQNADNTLVELTDVIADITLASGKWISVVSKQGYYEAAKKKITLVGDVNLLVTEQSGEVTQMITDEAVVDYAGGVISGDKKVFIKSSAFTFEGANFHLDKASQKINFAGGVKLIILKE